jgi:large conductance mechanosensitive channel
LPDISAPSPSNLAHGVGHRLGGFKKFLLRGNVVDLAVGIVIGGAFTNVVQAFVKDFVTPLISLFGGNPDASGLGVTLFGTRFQIGDFVNAVISFLIVAAVVYFLVVLPVNALMDRYKSEPQPAPTKDCSECLSRIPQAARRCSHCGAQLEAPSEAVILAMRRIAAPAGEDVADAAAEILTNRLRGGSDGSQRPPGQPGHAA